MPDPGYFAKLRLFLNGQRERGRRRKAKSASHRSAPSSFSLESLEPRVLLSADLTGAVTTHTLTDPSVPTNGESVIVRVTNQGSTATNTPPQVAVYASIDGTLDASDVLLGTANAPNKINARSFADVNVSFAMPSTLQAGNYRLLTKVDATNVIAESNENNNLAVGPMFGVVWQFGAVPGLVGATTLQLTDSDATLVTFKLNGPGTGTVVLDGTKWDIRVTGTDATSVLTIGTDAAGNGRVTIDDLFIGGPMKAINADKVDLVGSLAALGNVGDATLGSINGGTFAATSVTGTLMVKGNVSNATILIGANLGQDGKLGGIGANADTFGAGSLAKLVVNGNMTGSIVRVGVDPVDGIFGNGNDVIVGGTTSKPGILSIVGTMTNSQFFAGALPATASINGATITLAGNPSFSTDVQGPTLTAGLTQDTGGSSVDHITMNPGITGTLSDPSGIVSFVAGFGATPSFNILSDVVNGNFTLSQARLAQIYGGTLADGTYTLTLKATDIYGNPRQMALSFTLDTTVAQPVFDLAAASDTQIVGDQKTTANSVTLTGHTDPNALMELLGLGISTTADSTGLFTFTNVSLALGANALTARATDTAGNQKNFSCTIIRVAAPVLDPIANQIVNEGQVLSFTAHATDADTPASDLTYSLTGSVPVGATINPQTGLFTWTPAEGQGPGTYSFSVVVLDNGTPALSDSKPVQVTVNEVNQAPVLAPIHNGQPFTVDEGQPLTFTATATDADVPANTLTFSLQNAPAGAAIDPTTGVFTWTPTLAQTGQFNLSVVVLDNGMPALSTTTPVQITVLANNSAPVLDPIPDQTVEVGKLITIGVHATDSDIPAQTLSFSLIGTVPAGLELDPINFDRIGEQYYDTLRWIPTADQVGTWNFAVQVTDSGNPALSTVQPVQITVYSDHPTASFTATPNPAAPGQTITFDASASHASRPDRILSYAWNFGDGPLVTGPVITTHTYSAFNTWTVILTVTESNNPFKPDTMVIPISVSLGDRPPVAFVGGPYQVTAGHTLMLLGDSSDPDVAIGDYITSYQWLVNNSISLSGPRPTLTAEQINTLVGPPVPIQLTVTDSFGATDTAMTTLLVQPNSPPVLQPIPNQTITVGKLLTFAARATDDDVVTYSLAGTVPAGVTIDPLYGVISWTPTSDQIGQFSFAVVAMDNGTPALSATQLVSVTVQPNQPPVFAPITSPLFDVDSSGVAHATLYVGQELPLTVRVTDPDGDTITYSLQNAPVGASIDAESGAFHWTPVEAQVGQVNFAVIATDSGTPALSASQLLQITVTPPPPTFQTSTTSLTVTQGSSTSLSGFVVDDDPAAQLSVSLVNAPSWATLTVGSPSINQAGQAVLPVTVTASPGSDVAAGQYSFGIVATADGVQGTSVAGSFLVTVNPVLPPNYFNFGTGPFTVLQGSSVINGVTFVEPTAGAQLSVSLINAPSWITLTVQSSGVNDLGQAFESVLVTASPGVDVAPGDYSYIVKGTANGSASSVLGPVQVTVVQNKPPILAPINNNQPLTGQIGTLLSFTAVASDPDTGQTLTFSLGNAPLGAVIDPQTGVFHWTPSATQAGQFNFSVVVTDNGTIPLSASQSVNVMVPGNQPPVLAPINDFFRVNTGTLLTFTAVASDPDAGQTLMFSLQNAPTGATIDAQTGLFTWAPAAGQGEAKYNFTVVVTDNGTPALSASQTVDVTVDEVNLPPVANAGGPYTADLGSSLTLHGEGSSDPNAAAGDSIVTYQWDLGSDGTVDAIGATPTLSAAQINALGAGSFSVTLRVTDTFGAVGVSSTTLTIYNNQPVASFTATPNPTAPGQLLSFNPSESHAGRPDVGIVLYQWDFGDGSPIITTLNGTSVTHAYNLFGNYTVTLTVTDSNSPAKTATTSLVVNVNQGNRAPVANPGGPYSVTTGNSLTLNGAGSSDPDTAAGDSIASYQWLVNNTISLSGATPTLTAEQINTLPVGTPVTVQLTVTDSFGVASTALTTLTAQSATNQGVPPIVTLPPGGNLGYSGTPFDFLIPVSASDPDGGPPYRMTVAVSGATVEPQPGNPNPNAYNLRLHVTGPGTYTVTVTFTDKTGLSTTATSTWIVS